jgi:hypothetical protein
MSWTGWTAAVLGVVVVVLTILISLPGRSKGQARDSTKHWEGAAALGFGVILIAGPFWLAQLGFTVAAAVSRGGSLWLWLWLFAAPVFGGAILTGPAAPGVSGPTNRRGR